MSDGHPMEQVDFSVPVDHLAIQRVAAPLRLEVIERLRRAIVAVEFKPGERLFERDLTERWKVSRTVIREALRQLEAEGLVTIIPNRGPAVATLSREDAISLYEVREVLEPMLGKLFALRASAEQIHELHLALDDMHAALEMGGYTVWIEAKDRFYAVLFEGAQNSVMRALVRMVYARTMYLRGLALNVAGRRLQSFDELVTAMDAIDKRDADAAFAAFQFHVQNLASTAMQAFDESVEAGGTV